MKFSKRLAILVLSLSLLLTLLLCASAAVGAVSCGGVSYATLSKAVTAAQPGSVLQLNQDITETLTISKNLVLDLNSHKINGVVTVAEGYTLEVKDSTTDDFAAESYGKITASGDVRAADGYVALAEENGTSYHRLDLQISSVNLRPGTVGIYYGSNFGGDEAVKAQVEYYGTALSLTGAPTAQEIKADKHYSKHTAFSGESWVCGETGKAYGTLLKGIWKETNSQQKNAENAERKIYSASYVQLTDGTIILGDPVSMSLRDVVEKVDKDWKNLDAQQITAMYAMYEKHQTNMEVWNIPNLKRSEGHRLEEVDTYPETVYDEGVKFFECLDCEFEKEEYIPKIPSFAVSFYNENNRIISSARYALKTAKDEIVIPDVRVEDGYRFNTWVDATSGKDLMQIDFASAQENAIYQFKPTFTKLYEVAFVYYGSDGQLTEDILVMEENQLISREDLPEIPDREGYSSKWGEQIVGTKVTEDLTFSRVYEIKTFTVKFLDAKDGKELDKHTVEYGATVVTPEIEPYYYTTKKLFGFTGWKSSATDTLIGNASGNRVVKIKEDLTLYPAYESSISAPVIAAHIDDGQMVTMALCMPENTTLYSINLSAGWKTEGLCKIRAASIANATSLDTDECSSGDVDFHNKKEEWLTYNNKTKTFDFVWGCGTGHSFEIDRNEIDRKLITLEFDVNGATEAISEEIFSVLKGSKIVYGEKGGNISKAEKANIILWFY